MKAVVENVSAAPELDTTPIADQEYEVTGTALTFNFEDGTDKDAVDEVDLVKSFMVDGQDPAGYLFITLTAGVFTVSTIDNNDARNNDLTYHRTYELTYIIADKTNCGGGLVSQSDSDTFYLLITPYNHEVDITSTLVNMKTTVSYEDDVYIS